MKQPVQRNLLIALSIVLLSSCVNSKKLSQEAIYFQSVTDSSLRQTVVNYQSVIQKGDILGIRVLTANESSSKLFNQQTVSISGSASPGSGTYSEPPVGYLVDNGGNITFPLIGKLHVAGLTITAITDTLSARVKPFVTDGIVSLRLMNFKITVLGEVLRPGTMAVPNERVTILDAIGLAGDLSIFGRRDNIKVIREVNGKRELGVLNLKSGDIFNSPYYYLQQNDVVYVEMTNRKMANFDQSTVRNVSLGLAAISALAIIINTLNNL